MGKKNLTNGILSLSVFLYILLFFGLTLFIFIFYASYSVLSLSAVLLPLLFFLILLLILWKYSYLKNERKGKIMLFAIAVLCFIPPLFLVGLLGTNEKKLNFTTEKWMNNPDDRGYIVYDFLDENEIIGKTKEEIQKLLGVPEGNSLYNEENTIVYLLGLEIGLIRMDSDYLIIRLNDEEKVIDYEIVSG
ncbi:hypothetical protein [Psychrobacillus vulpis]|uniref:Outer membrane protein assembly factor BamE n=1 Tax=Psychrobacillus vulpis TaxID=2325572 RepID=A0A544TTS0_9BACI|nr:hypothetical protein [Psychrobacillus vulpis]TQR20861.1 hypothetical protein FG384_04510 [Psychrobacillus vulpis]